MTGGAPSSSEVYTFTVTFPRDEYLRCKSLTERDAYILKAAKGFLLDRVIDEVTDQLSECREGATQQPDDSERPTQTVHDEEPTPPDDGERITQMVHDEETTPPDHNRGRDDATVDGERDEATDDNKPEQHDAQQVRELQAAVEERIRRLTEPSDEAHEYRLRAIKNYKAPATYPPTTTVVTFDPALPATQQSNGKCKKLPPDVRRRYKESQMWWSKSERREFGRDIKRMAIVEKYRELVDRDTTSVVVPRRKFLYRRPVSNDTQHRAEDVQDTSAAEPLVLTPAELERVGELEWTKVEKGARSKTDQAPPKIETNNPFDAIAPPKTEDEPAQPCKPATTAPHRKPAAPAPKRSRGAVPKITAADVQKAMREVKEARRQETVKQQMEAAAARRAERGARHLQ